MIEANLRFPWPSYQSHSMYCLYKLGDPWRLYTIPEKQLYILSCYASCNLHRTQFKGMYTIWWKPVVLASYSGSRWAGKEKAWYPLFAHALNFSVIMRKWKLLCYICDNRDDITTTYRYIVRTQQWKHFNRSPAPSSSLWQLGTSDMSLKKVQVATSLGFCLKK